MVGRTHVASHLLARHTRRHVRTVKQVRARYFARSACVVQHKGPRVWVKREQHTARWCLAGRLAGCGVWVSSQAGGEAGHGKVLCAREDVWQSNARKQPCARMTIIVGQARENASLASFSPRRQATCHRHSNTCSRKGAGLSGSCSFDVKDDEPAVERECVVACEACT